MADLERLHALLVRQYGAQDVQLHPLPKFGDDAERGIYRVDHAQDAPWLLRAYRQSKEEDRWMAERAAVLLFLAAANYPAPRVIRTTAGALIGRCHDWSALLLTFVPGHIADGSPADFHAIGAALGQLHRVDVRRAAVATPAVPPARWHPTSILSGWIEDLVAVGGQIPHELQGVYHFSLATLQRVVRWDAPPLAILHADPWANNAIRTPEGEIVLVDWDGAGLGPAILDLGYLLVACHAFLPDWPQITPDAERIAAVLAGYCQERTLTLEEIAYLPDAIRFAEAFRSAQWLPTGIHDRWPENARLLKFLYRYPVTAAIAAIAQKLLSC